MKNRYRKLTNLHADLIKLSNAFLIDVVKKTECDQLVYKFNGLEYEILSSSNTFINEVLWGSQIKLPNLGQYLKFAPRWILRQCNINAITAYFIKVFDSAVQVDVGMGPDPPVNYSRTQGAIKPLITKSFIPGDLPWNNFS